jgi:two-component system, chemotaxis family, chemotaxis protein CheY
MNSNLYRLWRGAIMKSIVVIDDSPTIRTSVEYSLKKFGYPVRQAENGITGLSLTDEINSKGEDIALVIVDVNMPVMDGITFIQEFRKKDKFTPVLVLTTESEDEKIRAGKVAGASGWMIKPFRPADLINVVGKIIR